LRKYQVRARFDEKYFIKPFKLHPKDTKAQNMGAKTRGNRKKQEKEVKFVHIF